MQVDNKELKTKVKADPSQIRAELAAAFGVNDKTALAHLCQRIKVKKTLKVGTLRID